MSHSETKIIAEKDLRIDEAIKKEEAKIRDFEDRINGWQNKISSIRKEIEKLKSQKGIPFDPKKCHVGLHHGGLCQNCFQVIECTCSGC